MKMRKLIAGLVLTVACTGGALAGSPARVAANVATNGTSIAVPASGSAAYKLQAVVFGSATGTTHSVALVQGSITNQIATKTVTATDCMLTVTNAPWLFAGELVRITTTATEVYGVVLVGETGN